MTVQHRYWLAQHTGTALIAIGSVICLVTVFADDVPKRLLMATACVCLVTLGLLLKTAGAPAFDPGAGKMFVVYETASDEGASGWSHGTWFPVGTTLDGGVTTFRASDRDSLLFRHDPPGGEVCHVVELAVDDDGATTYGSYTGTYRIGGFLPADGASDG